MPCMHLPFHRMSNMPYPSNSSWSDHSNDIWWGVQSIKLLVMQSSPLPSYLASLRPKYTPQPPIVEHPQRIFLPQCKRPNFTSTRNNRQSCSSVCSKIYVFGWLLHRMITSILGLESAFNCIMNENLNLQGCSQIFGVFHPFKEYVSLWPYDLSLICYFVLHSLFETWLYT